MYSAILLGLSIIVFLLAYRFYSPIIAKKLGVDPDRPTPAHTMYDGVDYCPAKAPILFGHHFASIAGAGPIVGPIIAAAYGWVPVVIWIVLGGIFLGAMHDMGALIASVRHEGRSMGEVIGRYLGRTGKILFLVFLWATMVMLIAVYLDVVAKTFVAVPQAATASVLFIPLAVVFGLAVYRLHMNLAFSSILGIALLVVCMLAGWYWPIGLSQNAWVSILICYIFFASVAPVWLLLQPRDYLNSFLLYALLVAAIVGVFVARPQIEYPAFVTWFDPELGMLFPILFVTVACGAISGYHAVVAGGTTAKQLDRESHARPVAYGAMIVESLVAVIAVIMVMRLGRSAYSGMLPAQGPVAIFSQGVGAVLSVMGVASERGNQFAALAISAFVLTTLDTATRLARYALQEFFTKDDPQAKRPLVAGNRYIATAITVAASAALAFSGQWRAIWPIFGSANQLLAALALLAVALWLTGTGKKSNFLRVPMILMVCVTISALGVMTWRNIVERHFVLSGIAVALMALTVVLIVKSAGIFRGKIWQSPNR